MPHACGIDVDCIVTRVWFTGRAEVPKFLGAPRARWDVRGVMDRLMRAPLFSVLALMGTLGRASLMEHLMCAIPASVDQFGHPFSGQGTLGFDTLEQAFQRVTPFICWALGAYPMCDVTYRT